MNMQEAMKQLQSNPGEFFRRAGVDMPADIVKDLQAMVMHLINSGKVNNPLMQMVMPMIRQMTGK